MRERDKDRWFTRTGTTRSRSYEAMMDKTENRVRGVCRHLVGQISSWINGNRQHMVNGTLMQGEIITQR